MEAGEARPKQESKPMTDPPEDLGGVRLFAGLFLRLNLFAFAVPVFL